MVQRQHLKKLLLKMPRQKTMEEGKEHHSGSMDRHMHRLEPHIHLFLMVGNIQ
jgi:hypothetical protein